MATNKLRDVINSGLPKNLSLIPEPADFSFILHPCPAWSRRPGCPTAKVFPYVHRPVVADSSAAARTDDPRQEKPGSPQNPTARREPLYVLSRPAPQCRRPVAPQVQTSLVYQSARHAGCGSPTHWNVATGGSPASTQPAYTRTTKIDIRKAGPRKTSGKRPGLYRNPKYMLVSLAHARRIYARCPAPVVFVKPGLQQTS